MIPQQHLIDQYKEQFSKIYVDRPDQKGVGSSRYTNCFWLYAITRHLNPSLIVESGTWKGQSSWIFRQALQNQTIPIMCFDVSFDNLKWTDYGVSWYLEHDWNQFDRDIFFDNEDNIVFFDDHISHKQRLQEAIDRGFKRLIFDDNIPDSMVKLKKNPPAPTLQQLYRRKDPITQSIKTYQVLPRLNDEPDTYITYVELI